MTDFIFAPIEVITDSNLTGTELKVLLALFSFRGKNTNIVYPSIETIADRVGINDIPRVSKITGSLVKKGWVVKKKRGFSGCNSYELTVPDIENTLLAETTNNEETTKNVECTNSNLAECTNSNLAESAKYKEEHIEEQKEEYKNKDISITKPSAKKSKNNLDYSCWPSMPSAQVMDDWIAMRARKKANVSQTVVNAFGKELFEAVAIGYTVDECITQCVVRNWQGFKAAWLINSGETKHARTETDIRPDDTSWARDLPGFGEQDFSAIEGDFSRVETGDRKPGSSKGNAQTVVHGIAGGRY